MELEITRLMLSAHALFPAIPAGVCITPQALETATMQLIAAEMAVSETAFLARDDNRLRWFTPQAEVDYAVTARSPRPIFCARPGSLLLEKALSSPPFPARLKPPPALTLSNWIFRS